eukprot:1678004-Rhodomonas_salina.1
MMTRKEEDRLPTASTCMNLLKLPVLPAHRTIREKKSAGFVLPGETWYCTASGAGGVSYGVLCGAGSRMSFCTARGWWYVMLYWSNVVLVGAG